MGFFQALTEKSWLTSQGTVVDLHAGTAFQMPRATLGLRFFLGVITVLFSLLLAAYIDRMAFADWHAFAKPWLLWPNTGVLILSGLALQWARAGARREDMGRVRAGLLAAGAFTVAFLVGQIVAWWQVTTTASFSALNPAIAFFYLITALHGLHLLGGLVAWSRTNSKVRHGLEMTKIRLSLERCAIYWQYLLLVWIVMFALLLLT